MADKYVSGQIQNIFLTSDGMNTGLPFKARLEASEEFFRSAYTISARVALDFTVHTQVANRGVAGCEFVLLLEYASESTLNSILTILGACLSSGNPVRVQLQHLETIDVLAMPLTQGGRLYTFESRSLGIARNVRLRFISTGAGS